MFTGDFKSFNQTKGSYICDVVLLFVALMREIFCFLFLFPQAKAADKCIYGKPYKVSQLQGGGSARDKEYIMSPLTSIINFKHFHSFLPSYSKIPTQYFYFESVIVVQYSSVLPQISE